MMIEWYEIISSTDCNDVNTSVITASVVLWNSLDKAFNLTCRIHHVKLASVIHYYRPTIRILTLYFCMPEMLVYFIMFYF